MNTNGSELEAANKGSRTRQHGRACLPSCSRRGCPQHTLLRGEVVPPTDATFALGEMGPADWHTVRHILDHGRGYVILRGFPVEDRPEAAISADFEALVSRFGTVTPHGASRQTIWRITPRADLKHIPTFSEAASEAPFHTDNSWVQEPERYFALLVIRPAQDGGASLLCPVAELLRDFAQTREGPATIRTLSERLFPFAMPVVFRSDTECAAQHVPVVTSPVILAHSALRYRYDVLKAGFQVRPDLATEESVRAVEVFNEYLTGVLQRSAGVKLDRGDLLLANNHTLLHARTDFTDPQRLLLRARIGLPVTRN
jgi:alpha-ketoglutarate-dependent taurine dioxygenase